MTTSLYEHIEIVTNFYDDERNPFRCNWTDVEGMGYGWVWMQYEEKDWHKMMGKLVQHETKSLLKVMDDTLYFVYEKKKAKTYHFVTMGRFVTKGGWREDTIITLSNEELFY
ncbi:hypothetical protein [Cytobacillus gottheilii]|uniref:hypothetical protein n=1 Tax=Cytobacillus gottheilii TaxID=859144 RepID=UPI0009BAFC80|nr:hypothetical protein [Cytobacillus gottheilii]